MPKKVGATNTKRFVGVKVDADELARMISASCVDAAGTAVLALARIGLRVMLPPKSDKSEVRS